VLCFIAIVVVTGVLRLPGSGAVWNIVVTLPLIGLPLGFLMFVGLLTINFVRRRRQSSGRV
jgi:hypothetical protein